MFTRDPVYEDYKIVISLNTSGEVFIRHKQAQVLMRVSDTDRGFRITAHDHLLTPTSIHTLPAFEVWGDRFSVSRKPTRCTCQREPGDEAGLLCAYCEAVAISDRISENRSCGQD